MPEATLYPKCGKPLPPSLRVPPGAGCRIRAGLLLAAMLIFGGRQAISQLAITEAMSVASTNLGPQRLPQNSDYWELTNFGTNDIPLSGYKWNDNAGGLYSGATLVADDLPFLGLTIHAGESILFVQSDTITNAQQFRDWWGSGLPPDLQIVFYGGNGFNGQGDGIRLWGPEATNTSDVIDSVDFPDANASRGRSFNYDPETGLFGALSRNGAGRAFQAVTRDDQGSPGFTTGPVPLRVLAQPTNLTLCAGLDATFVVRAGGLPRPRYQWFFNGIAIPGATARKLIVPNVQLTNIGAYQVEISNGFATVRSDVATLAVSAAPSAPSLFQPLTDAAVLLGETARFAVEVCAFPPPTYQWLSNGVALAGANARMLVIPNCEESMSGTIYCVQVANSNGSMTACARLTVTPKPKLLITEVMAWPATNCNESSLHGDWFELTNFDTNTVNLLGYRFANDQLLEGAQVVEQPVVLAPGESAIFVEKMTPEAFRRWWGADALPPGLPVIRVPAFGLKQAGEEIYLWSAGVEDERSPVSLITSLSYAFASNGASFRFDENECFFGCDSVAGESGAFRSAECGDIGSPGYTTNPPPRLASVARDTAGVAVRWRAVEGRRYRLWYKNRIEAASWTPLGTHTATNGVMTVTDTAAANVPLRFYRVEELP